MAQLPGVDVKLIRLNPEWSVENAASTPLEQNLSINDFSGKRLIITLPGAGGFCNKELDQVKESMDASLVAGATPPSRRPLAGQVVRASEKKSCVRAVLGRRYRACRWQPVRRAVVSARPSPGPCPPLGQVAFSFYGQAETAARR